MIDLLVNGIYIGGGQIAIVLAFLALVFIVPFIMDLGD